MTTIASSLRISVGRTRLYLKCYAGCDELAIRDHLIRSRGSRTGACPSRSSEGPI